MFCFIVLLMFFLKIELTLGFCTAHSDCSTGQYCHFSSFQCLSGCITCSICPVGHFCDLSSGSPGTCTVSPSSSSPTSSSSPSSEENDEFTTAEQAAVATSITAAAAAAVAPPPINMFPPQGAPQPGAVSAGGGITPAVALTTAVVAADVTLLTAGIAGAVVLSVYSSDLATSGFLIPRTVDATAVTFTEPDDAIPRTSISRQSTYGNTQHQSSCSRPIIHLGRKINRVANKNIIKSISNKFEKVRSRIGRIKMGLYDKLGIGCLFPKLIHPFEPTLRYFRCKLGLEEDEYMEAAQCNAMACEESLEEKFITNDLGPAPMEMMNLDVQTMSDCFGNMRAVKYGARVLAKIVRDGSCDDPKYQQICQDLLNENRVIEREKCRTSDCIGPEDDPFRPCFECEGFRARYVYGNDYHNDIERSFISRQTGENFQTTKQSKRIVCRNGRANCRLRVDRGVQLRKRTYARVQEFVQSEQYLSQEDIDILRFYIK